MAQATSGFSVEAVNRRLKEEAKRRRRTPLKGKPKPVTKPANPKGRRKPIDYFEGFIPHDYEIGEDGQPRLIKKGRPGKYTRKDGKFIPNPDWPYNDKSSTPKSSLPIGRKPQGTPIKKDALERRLNKKNAAKRKLQGKRVSA